MNEAALCFFEILRAMRFRAGSFPELHSRRNDKLAQRDWNQLSDLAD